MEFPWEAVAQFWGRVNVRRPSLCWEYKTPNKFEGYGVVRWLGKTERAHRIAWMLATGENIPEGVEILHHCDNRICCNPHHLFDGDHEINMEDATRKGRMNRGQNNGRARLTAGQVARIKRLLADGERQCKEIAPLFNVCPATIMAIHRGRTWKDIQPEKSSVT